MNVVPNNPHCIIEVDRGDRGLLKLDSWESKGLFQEVRVELVTNETSQVEFTLFDRDFKAIDDFAGDDGVKMWLNEKEIYRLDIGRPYSAKSDHVAVKLKKGTNTLLVKIFQGGGDGGFGVHVEDANGRPLTQVKPHLKP